MLVAAVVVAAISIEERALPLSIFESDLVRGLATLLFELRSLAASRDGKGNLLLLVLLLLSLLLLLLCGENGKPPPPSPPTWFNRMSARLDRDDVRREGVLWLVLWT